MRKMIVSLICWGLFHSFSVAQTNLSFRYDNHIVLSGKINGQFAARLVLDSGADGLYLDSTFFAESGILIQRSQQATLPGAGSKPQQITVVLDTITADFGGIDYTPRFVPLIALRPILGQEVDGIIGMSFLRDHVVELDYQKRSLTLTKPEGFSPPKGFEEIPLSRIGNRVYLSVRIGIEGQKDIVEQFQIDLGNGGTVDITSPMADKYDLKERVRKKLSYVNVSGGIGGEIRGNQFRAKYLRLGNFTIESPVIDYSEDSSGALAKDDIGGLLGNEIFERFKVIFDFPQSKLYLKPTGNNEPFHSNLLGFSYTNRFNEHGGLLITGLFENTDAVAADIRVGDVITHINDRTVQSMGMSKVKTVFKEINTKVRLVIVRDGKSLKKEINIKDYL